MRDYAKIDPVLTGCLRRFSYFNWKDLNWSSKPSQNLLCEAIKNGVGKQGLSLPIHGPFGQSAIFTLNHNDTDKAWETFVRNQASNILLTGHHINRKALELIFKPKVHCTDLSRRESEALEMLALGYNRSRAAEALSISEHTLRVYLENARHKLGAITTVQAVAKAASQGLIQV